MLAQQSQFSPDQYFGQARHALRAFRASDLVVVPGAGLRLGNSRYQRWGGYEVQGLPSLVADFRSDIEGGVMVRPSQPGPSWFYGTWLLTFAVFTPHSMRGGIVPRMQSTETLCTGGIMDCEPMMDARTVASLLSHQPAHARYFGRARRSPGFHSYWSNLPLANG